MRVVKVLCILLTLRSNSILPSAHAEIEYNNNTFDVTKSLENIIDAVKSLETQLELQESKLNDFVTSLNKLASDMEGQQLVPLNTVNCSTTTVKYREVELDVPEYVSLDVEPTGIFAATTRGLLSVDLRTLEVAALTSKYTAALAVNRRIKKVYWSESRFNSYILRSNFDGSLEETIVPQTGDAIYRLAVHEPSGNIYFALYSSNEIRVCNELGSSCSTVINDIAFVNQPVALAFDSHNSAMYWGGNAFPNYLVRANLDGSNATIISTEFSVLRGFTFDRSSTEVLYWADYEKNAIGAIDANADNKRILAELMDNQGPCGIQADTENIYFSTYDSRNIYRVKKDSGKDMTVILNSTGHVGHLALFDVPA